MQICKNVAQKQPLCTQLIDAQQKTVRANETLHFNGTNTQ